MPRTRRSPAPRGQSHAHALGAGSPPVADAPPRQWRQPPTRIWAPGERERLQQDARRAREEESRRRQRELDATRRAQAETRIRPLEERDQDLFRLLFRNKPVFNDAVVRRYWGHMESVWKEALMGYRWCWRPGRGAAPCRVAIDLAYVRVLVRQMKWITTLRMKEIV